MKVEMIDFKLFDGFCFMTDKQTDGQTFVIVESLQSFIFLW